MSCFSERPTAWATTRFAGPTADAVAWVANGLLSRLDWEKYADCLPEDEREEKRAFFQSNVGSAYWVRMEAHVPPFY